MSTTNAAPSLKALAESKTDGVQKQTTFRVDPDLIEFEEGFNLRADDDTLHAHIDRLYEAMKNGASVPPLDVRVDLGRIVCVEGHCRTIAGRRLKKEIPDFTLEARQFRGNEQERVLHMLGTGSGQKPLTPLEQGMGYLRLVKYGMNSTQIAAKLGVSRVTVDNGLTLAEAPLEVQELVKSGVVSSTVAREAVKQGPEGVQALKEAAAAPDAPTPANGKKSSKKKVTKKKLKDTAAVKKAPKKKGKKAEAQAAAPAAPEVVSEPTGEGEILVKVKKDQASSVAAFLRANAPEDDAGLKEFAAALEMACL